MSVAAAAATTARFSKPGTYVLRLSANDSQLSASDQITVTVVQTNRPPTVDAGADQTLRAKPLLCNRAAFARAALRRASHDCQIPRRRLSATIWPM